MWELSVETQRPMNRKAFHKLVSKGRLFAFVLMRIARSWALQMHLANIEDQLKQYVHAPVVAPSTFDNPEAPDSEALDDELDTIRLDNSQLHEQQEQPPGLLAKMFATWILLLILQFDAIEILVTYVDGSAFQQSYTDIDIKILLAPTTSSQVLDWRKLFDDPEIFPATGVSSTMTNAQIKDALSKAVNEAQIVKKLRVHAGDLPTEWKHAGDLQKFVGTAQAMSELARAHSSLNPEFVKDLSNLVNLLSKRQATSSHRQYLFITHSPNG